MSEEFQLCEGCPTNPPCGRCPSRPKMRDGRPAPVAVKPQKKERPPLDRSKMGFGNHSWDYINPADVPTDFGPPDGVARRDFNNAFNRPNEATTVTIDHMSRPGALIETDAAGFEGRWVVAAMPQYKDGVLWAYLLREGDEDQACQIVPMVDLGVIADRYSNMYKDNVVTTLISGGRATSATREALTKKADGSY